MIYGLRIFINYDNLASSRVVIRNSGEKTVLLNPISLSNFIFFQDTPIMCFSNEDGHVVFLESGDSLDHSFADQKFEFVNHVDATCSNVSRLVRVGTTCKLTAHCEGKVALFDIRRQSQEPTLFSEADFGLVFVCPDEQFVGFRNATLSLYSESRIQHGNSVLFPVGAINQGDCLIENQQHILVATLGDGRTFFVNFSDTSYHQLGESEYAVLVASKVKGQVAFVNSESETLLYNLSLTCEQNPIVLSNNFILANFFSTSTTDQCPCPILPTSSFFTVPVSESLTPSLRSSTITPSKPFITQSVMSSMINTSLSHPVPPSTTEGQTGPLSLQGAIVAVAVVVPGVLLSVVILTLVTCLYKW